MEITKELRPNKTELLSYFRGRASEILNDLSRQYSAADFKKKASALNKAIIRSKENLLAILYETSKAENWSTIELLESVLMITYTNDVVMLEARNSVWEYDYMAFSRRVGELWEPFCKLCFAHPMTNIHQYIPPLFSEVKSSMSIEINSYIDQLALKAEEKEQLRRYYEKVWRLVTSGEIQLECDLHFTDGHTRYVIDFKSGFGSNEKGNTNRLLLVGSVFKNIDIDNYNCIIFVRSTENNHYLSRLQDSGVWETYCGDNAYQKIYQFSGFNIHQWIENNVDWINDFSEEMRQTIVKRDLQSYLKW